jgi:hypothetical protein
MINLFRRLAQERPQKAIWFRRQPSSPPQSTTASTLQDLGLRLLPASSGRWRTGTSVSSQVGARRRSHKRTRQLSTRGVT